jgi:hypothetical protein
MTKLIYTVYTHISSVVHRSLRQVFETSGQPTTEIGSTIELLKLFLKTLQFEFEPSLYICRFNNLKE